MKMLHRLIFCMGFLFSSNASAVMGVGDLSYDPTVDAQLIKMFNQGKEIYVTAKDQLKTIAEVNNTIYEAEQAYDKVVNFKLKKTIDGMFDFSKTGRAEMRWKAQTLLNDLDKMERTGGKVGRFYEFQASKIKALENLISFQETATSNAKLAATDIPVRQSSQVTAQSSAALAALASAKEHREQVEELKKQRAEKYDSETINGLSGSIYKTMGAE